VVEPPPPPVLLELLEELLVLCATGLTVVTFPSAVLPSGSCTLTGSPTTASLCFVASSATETITCVEVVWRIGVAEPEPADDVPALDEPALGPPPFAAELDVPALPPPELRPPLEPLVPADPEAEPEAEPELRPELPDEDDEASFFSSATSCASSSWAVGEPLGFGHVDAGLEPVGGVWV